MLALPASPVHSVLASPGPAPAYAPAAVANRVTITKAPGRVGRGYYASVTAKTTPGKMSCGIIVLYKSGASVAQGLYRKTSSASGVVSWAWKVGTKTTPGSWPVVITCGRGSAR